MFNDELSAAQSYYVAQPTRTATATYDGHLYRIPLSSLEYNADAFWKALQEHGFFVLTDIGEGERLFKAMNYQFVHFCTQSDMQQKKISTSAHLYRNEKGVPMWYCGKFFWPFRQ